MKKLIAGFASLVGLAACGEDTPFGTVTHFSSHDSTYTFMRSATARGPLLVDVFGSYPGYETETVAPLIREAMIKGFPKRPFKATGNLAEAHSPAYRVIWLIAPPGATNANRVCQGDIPASIPGDKPTFATIFCSNDKVLRNMTGWVRDGITPDQEPFKKFVGVVTRDLFD